MPKKVCPNGHIYDAGIYGDECPLCPKGGNETQYNHQQNFVPQQEPEVGGTMVSPPAGSNPMAGTGQMAGGAAQFGGMDVTGETIVRGGQQVAGRQQAAQGSVGGGTVIRQPKGAAMAQGRKLVGFLVTYNRNPLGKAFNIYEGKNYIGRDRNCDISVPEDNQMSGRHMSILYRNVDNKFKYRDEQSSNGTFVNKELSDEGELKNYDIIRLGNTVFIFIAIPKLG